MSSFRRNFRPGISWRLYLIAYADSWSFMVIFPTRISHIILIMITFTTTTALWEKNIFVCFASRFLWMGLHPTPIAHNFLSGTVLFSRIIIIPFFIYTFVPIGVFTVQSRTDCPFCVVLQHAVGVRYFVFHQSGEVPEGLLLIATDDIYIPLCCLSPFISAIVPYILDSSAIICCCKFKALACAYGDFQVNFSVKRKRGKQVDTQDWQFLFPDG